MRKIIEHEPRETEIEREPRETEAEKKQKRRMSQNREYDDDLPCAAATPCVIILVLFILFAILL